MLTKSQSLGFCRRLFQSVGDARAYPGYRINERARADLLIVTPGHLLGFLGVDPAATERVHGSAEQHRERIRTFERTFDANYAAIPAGEQKSVRLLPNWGVARVGSEKLTLARGPRASGVDLWRQLALLWKGEIEQILREAEHPAPPGCSKVELVVHALGLGLPEGEMRGKVRQALLGRSYHVLGRGDYTFGRAQDGSVIMPDDSGRLVVPDHFIHEVCADPADRLPAGQAPREVSIAELQDEAARMGGWCAQQGFEVPGWAIPLIYESVKRETCGLVAPAVRKGDASWALSLGRTLDEDMRKAAVVEEEPAKEDMSGGPPEGFEGPWVDRSQIEAVPGVPWISRRTIEDFARYLCYGDGPLRVDPNDWLPGVAHSPLTGAWAVAHNEPENWTPTNLMRLEHKFGVPGWNALRILDATLNLKEIRLRTESETLGAIEKQEMLLEEFKSWLWRDPKRARQVERAYNELFAGLGPKEVSGAELEFPGMSSQVRLFDYQKDAVARILSQKNTLLALDTGAGKTYIMIAAAMLLRQQGRSPKNVFIVPNNIVGQWRSIFLAMYPSAKLLVVEPRSFGARRKDETLRRFRDEDFDGIIVAYSCCERLPLSEKWIRTRHGKEKEALDAEYEMLERQYPQYRFNRVRRAVARTRNTVWHHSLELMKASNRLMPECGITFDELGITGIFLDEAHNYKNVPIQTNLGTSIGGISVAGSMKCEAMLAKVRCVQEAEHGWGAVLATATPLSNSIADAYTMQQYVQPEELRATGLHMFDSWVKTFAKPEAVCEIDVDTSRFRYARRLARFFNLPELSRMFSSAAAFHAMDGSDGMPELQGYTNELILPGEPLTEFMRELVERTERIRAGKVSRAEDNMLRVSVHGRMAALDLRLVGREQPYDEHSKIRACVENVMQVYEQNEGCTQIIFCDYSTPKSDAFNVYDDLHAHLMERGVPADEIAFIHSYPTEAQKAHLYGQVNDGDVRILIGSTFKLGIGTNVQRRLKAIHHLDVPWRPADMVQREGRILRKGNLNAYVSIFRYVCEGSFDAYSWQLLEQKQKFIAQFLLGSPQQSRSSKDLDDSVLSYAQVKALAINEPIMRVLAEKENELRRYRLLAENFQTTSAGLRQESDKLAGSMQKRREFSDATRANAEHLQATTKEEIRDAGKELRAVLTTDVLMRRKPLPDEARHILGFEISLPAMAEQSEAKPFLYLSRHGATYRLDMGDSAQGNVRRITNFLNRFGDEAKRAEDALVRASAKVQANEQALEASNPYQGQILALEREVSSLRDRITHG